MRRGIGGIRGTRRSVRVKYVWDRKDIVVVTGGCLERNVWDGVQFDRRAVCEKKTGCMDCYVGGETVRDVNVVVDDVFGMEMR